MMKLQLTEKQNIWFCSDPHYDHAGLVRGTSNWEGLRGTRDFRTLREHNANLVNNINKVVKLDDVLFCLGDWSFGGYKTGDNVENVGKFRQRINCDNVHLIYGNHDTEIRKDYRLQSYFSTVQDYLELQVAIQYPGKAQGIKAIKQHIVMCHYAMRVWNKSHHNSFHLYGHSHGSLEHTPHGKSMDVGFDTHPEFRPYSFQEIYDILDSREKLLLDHHE